ncbi:mitochondrial basic amino acids transporter [Ixodes scapularis]|nr:mitochondrial basic amino acids transporter [Ixodes scapularis]
MALDFVAGCLGGCAGVIVGHPFDTIKVRLQTQDGSSPKYRGSIDCFKSIIRTEKVQGLFRGMTSPMAGVAVVNAIVFGVYGNAQKQLGDSAWAHGACGLLAGSVQSLVSSPVELAKTRLQVQGQGSSRAYSGPLDCLRQLLRAEGCRGVFRGLGSTVLRDAPAFGVYFASYEQLVRRGTGGPVHLMAAGGLAGVLSWMVSYPCDVVKSRLQVDGMTGPRRYSGFWDCAVKSYRNEGAGVFTRGLNSTLLRAFPTNAAIFTVVTWVFRAFDPSAEADLHPHPHHHHHHPAVHFDPELHLSRVAVLMDFHF